MTRRKYVQDSYRESTTVEKTNELFETFYKGQHIVNEEEWDNFLTYLRRDLPVTFRITGFRDQNKELLRFIKERFVDDIAKLQHLLVDETNGNQSDGSFGPLPWYPNEMAWQLNSCRYTIRKTQTLRSLKEFLLSETESGNISRQEAVSMLPPLVMNLKSHHTVLDMCAAPGSKSAQLVEYLHSDAESGTMQDNDQTEVAEIKKYSEPTGMIIANDVEQKRCYMMVHQVKRLQSPCVLITQEDASCFPRLYLTQPKEDDKSETKHQLFFDRVLADVPCSGDGTLRKNPGLWKRWSPNLGIGQHTLQLKILRRGLELLRDPGENCTDYARLVYSTCSFNPMENEAVVANVLNICQGSVRLVEPDLFQCISSTKDIVQMNSNKFKVRPGLKTWQVMDKKGTWFSTFDDVPVELQNYLRPSLFPPLNVSEFNLEHCRRVLPHDQNTGGFFVAVLEKVARLPWLRAPKPNIVPNNGEKLDRFCDKEESGSFPVLKKRRIFNENPFIYINSKSDSNWAEIRDYYNIMDEWTTSDDDVIPGPSSGVRCFQASNLLSRTQEKKVGDKYSARCFYYTNSLVKNVISTNMLNGFKFINTGVRVFALIEDKLYRGFRLLQDGVDIYDAILSCKNGRRLHLTSAQYQDLVILLEHEMPLISLMSEATQTQFNNLSIGPVLIDYSPDQEDDQNKNTPRCRLLLAGWRGLKSLRHYAGRYDRLHMMRMVNIEPKPCIMGPSNTRRSIHEDELEHIENSE